MVLVWFVCSSLACLTQCHISFIGSYDQQAAHEGQQEQYPNLDNLTCSYCYKVFREPASLRVHIRDLHEAVSMQHECGFCNKIFKSINTLRNHKSLYHKGQK